MLITISLLVLIISTVTALPQNQTCSASCDVFVPSYTYVEWVPQEYSTTIVAATVYEVINTNLSTTSYSTKYNSLPAGYTVPTNTNAEGTQTVDVTWTSAGTVSTIAVTFPNDVLIWRADHTWQGILPTTDPGHRSVCSTVPNGDNSPSVTVHQSTPSPTLYPTVDPFGNSRSLGSDPLGLDYTTRIQTDGGALWMYYKLETMFPYESALQLCEPRADLAPLTPVLTAKFTTATSTIHT